MKEKEFLSKAKQFKQHWRAECKSKNGHWKGTWKDSYNAAFDQGDKHRYGGAGQNSMHDIKIVMRGFSEASIS